MQRAIAIETRGPGLYEFTQEASDFVTETGKEEGLLTVFIRHTSCSLLIQENADPDVQVDLLDWLGRFIPPANTREFEYLRHTAEGPDDMPAHLKAAILPVSLSIPVRDGRPMLGTWQGIFLFEHRVRPHRRNIVLDVRD